MRIWDINAGYLNRQSLLGEHRELHGIVSIISNKKKGYSHHPETLRWVGYGWALRMRHLQLKSEMILRGYVDKSVVRTRSGKGAWPATYIDLPAVQFKILKEKYKGKEQGRIPLPITTQELWSQHKYSVLARNPVKYKAIGQTVARAQIDFDALANILTELLRVPPSIGGIRNAVQHMWGYVSAVHTSENLNVEHCSLNRLLSEVQQRTMKSRDPYLTSSTSLSELMAWI